MATRVPVQSAQTPYAAFSLPYVLYMKFDHNLTYILLCTEHQYTHYHTSLEPEPLIQVR